LKKVESKPEDWGEGHALEIAKRDKEEDKTCGEPYTKRRRGKRFYV